jgi:hypothetical protein
MRTWFAIACLVFAPIAMADPHPAATQTSPAVAPATPAAAPPATPAAAPQTPAAAPVAGAQADRVICKPNTPTGSRISRGKVCRTKKQWDMLAAGSQNAVDEAQRRALVGVPTGS